MCWGCEQNNTGKEEPNPMSTGYTNDVNLWGLRGCEGSLIVSVSGYYVFRGPVRCPALVWDQIVIYRHVTTLGSQTSMPTCM